MGYKLTETVIEYHPADLVTWKKNEKDKLLGNRKVPQEVYNQPEYHFGEYFVLTYFEKALWHGYCFYSFSTPCLEKFQEGQNKITELFPDDLLEAFLVARKQSRHSEGKGQPDLFLYMENGPKLFLEVKKDGDRISDAQLECLAKIRGILHAEVGIVHLVQFGHQHTPKTFDLDLVTYQCRQVLEA
jgi:hypothetical protein